MNDGQLKSEVSRIIELAERNAEVRRLNLVCFEEFAKVEALNIEVQQLKDLAVDRERKHRAEVERLRGLVARAINSRSSFFYKTQPNEPCDECGVDTVALLDERDKLKAEVERLRGTLRIILEWIGETRPDLLTKIHAILAPKEESK